MLFRVSKNIGIQRIVRDWLESNRVGDLVPLALLLLLLLYYVTVYSRDLKVLK